MTDAQARLKAIEPLSIAEVEGVIVTLAELLDAHRCTPAMTVTKADPEGVSLSLHFGTERARRLIASRTPSLHRLMRWSGQSRCCFIARNAANSTLTHRMNGRRTGPTRRTSLISATAAVLYGDRLTFLPRALQLSRRAARKTTFPQSLQW
jgi:hypothetical protein